MKTVAQLCKPRENVFLDTSRDDTLNLSNLMQGSIDADQFFSENFMTSGMRALITTAFKRFKGESPTGVIKMTQAMGGGKTHNMIALGLLATNETWRKKIVGRDMGQSYANVGDIKVIAFSGRESDYPFGIWGSLADQLGKKDLFKDLYAPLRAPGESAWINLLKGQKILILLDELPPYLDTARSVAVGSTDLSHVTVTALSNLFSALGKEELSNVCLVFSDLRASYEMASGMIQSTFKDLENEANRVAINITPVELNSDEIYDILRKRLFETVPGRDEQDVKDIAEGYRKALEAANKSGLTSYQSSTLYTGIRDCYPFHPSIKDLYARFKENTNFQQTRGLIRLMRQIVRQFYENKTAETSSLVNVYDINLNDATILGFIREIKPSLEVAISHDIAQHGKSVAEIIDKNYSGEYPYPYAQTVARLLLMSSLSDTAHALLGLTDSEILGFVCAPDMDMGQYNKVLDEIKQQSWYLKADNRGRTYYQNTKNLIAEMHTLVDSYTNESARKDLKKTLEQIFAPKLKKCYETVYVMPAVDEIALTANKIALVVFEPYPGTGLHPDLLEFYKNAVYKNRVMFLSGQKVMMERLYDNSKKLMAIRQIIKTLQTEHVSEMDQQYIEAQNQMDKAQQALLSTIRETFVTLYFPTKNGIVNEDFKLEFKGNQFNGEEQIVQTLTDASKFEDFTQEPRKLETIRQKCEQRIFTQKEMPWNTIMDRAATTPAWQWYHPDQMNTLRSNALSTDKWRDIGGYITKGPFPKDPTRVQVTQQDYNPDTHEFVLKVMGINGNAVYWDVGSEPSTASALAESTFVTKETELYFVCVDTSKEDPHPTGDVLHFYCKAPLRYEQRLTAHGNVMQLESNPDYEIRYTTDGSNPKEGGGLYNGEFVLNEGTRFVNVAVYNHGQLIEEKTIPVTDAPKKFEIDDVKPLNYKAKKSLAFIDTSAVFDELSLLEKTGAFISDCTVESSDQADFNRYVTLTTSAAMRHSAVELRNQIETIRHYSGFTGSQISLRYRGLYFPTGAQFKQWLGEHTYDLEDMKDGITQ